MKITNMEYYRTEIEKIIEQNDAFGIVNSEFIVCNGIHCVKCMFGKSKEPCVLQRIKWLMEEYEEEYDVVPDVIHAKWIISSDGYYPYCSNCKHRPDKMTKFCPECGAKMDGDKYE